MPKQKRSGQTQTGIVAAATSLFVQKGYSQVTMQDIADAAGIGKATLYYHTPSKEDLGLLVIDAHLDEFMDSAREAAGADRRAAGADRPASERFRAAVDLLTSWLSAGQELVEFMLPYRAKSSTKHMNRLKKFRRGYLDLLEGLVREGMASGEFRSDLDPAVAVRAILGMIVHFHVLATRFGEPYRIANVRDQLATMALAALTPGAKS